MSTDGVSVGDRESGTPARSPGKESTAVFLAGDFVFPALTEWQCHSGTYWLARDVFRKKGFGSVLWVPIAEE